MATLVDTTVVRHPSTRKPVVLHKGDRLPDWAQGLVGAHLLDEPADADAESPATSDAGTPGGGSGVEPPPRAGKGSGREAWTEHATALGIDVTDDMGRDEIVALIEAKGLPA